MAGTLSLYGIANCDTVRKARKWLEAQQLDYTFYDVREQPLTLAQLQQWASQLGWEQLFNKRSTSYRDLDDTVKQQLDETLALQLILQYPTLMKRPLLQSSSQLILGFNETRYQSLGDA